MSEPRPYILHESNYRQLLDAKPNVAVLPWGATEAHNYHLPHGTDVIEAGRVAERAAGLAFEKGAKVVVLPAIPFGNDEQQLDQVATISITTPTAGALLDDVARSLKSQGIDRLVIVNGHGGNEFKPLVRDVQQRRGVMIVVINFWQIAAGEKDALFYKPGDHADEMETSLLLHLTPEWVVMGQAGEGKKVPFDIEALRMPGVWTPRPWSKIHPDTGCGDPSGATAEKGKKFFEAVAGNIAKVLVDLSKAERGDLPYV